MRQRPANYYDAFDEVYRASWGMALHHGWFDRERCRCGPADVLLRFEEEIVRRLQLDRLASIVLCDVGCGYGTLASSLVTRGLIDKVVAVTDSKSQVDHALRTLPRSNGLQIQHGSWLQNAFPADSFDRLIAIESLYHFPGDEKLSAIREMARVLRPSGRAVVTVWLKKDDGLWSRLVDRGMRAWDASFGSLATEVELRAWFHDCRLAVEQFDDVSTSVSPTIPLLVRRILSTLWTEPSVFLPLLAQPGVIVRAGVALACTWLGYITGALRYAIAEIGKPDSY